MKVLKANTQQYNELNGYRNGNSVLEFTQDANGNWIVGTAVLSDAAFAAIHDSLDELERINYVPVPEPEDI